MSAINYRFFEQPLYSGVIINDQPFAVFFKPLTSENNINLNLDPMTLIFCSDLRAEGTIRVKAKSIYVLDAKVEANGDVFLECSLNVNFVAGTLLGMNININTPNPNFVGQDKLLINKITSIFKSALEKEDVLEFLQGLYMTIDATLNPRGDKVISLREKFQFLGIPFIEQEVETSAAAAAATP